MKQKVIIPERLSDLTLSQYQKFLKVVDGNEDDLFIRKKMVQIFCDLPLIEVEYIKKNDFDEITAQIIKVLGETPDLQERFEHNGIQYGMIPNLNDDISLGEFIGLDQLTGNWDAMP